MKNYRNYLFLLTVLLISSACESMFDKEIDYEIPRVPDQITIDTRLIAGDSLFVLPGVSSYSLSSDKPKTDTNFVVRLFENDHFVEQLQYDTTYPGGFFSGHYKIKNQQRYRVEASLGDYTTAYGEDIVPDAPEIISAIARLSGNDVYITIDFKDRSGTADIYKFRVMYDSDDYSGGPWPIVFSTYDPVVEVYYHEEILNEIKGEVSGNAGFLKDNNFEGQTKRIELKCKSSRFNIPELQCYFELSRVTPNLYEHERSKGLYSKDSDIDFLAGPVQVFSNITNGLGIVAGQAATTAPLVP